MRITIEMLCKAGACRQDRRAFAHEWPEGCDVTDATLARAQELSLDVEWAVGRLLSYAALEAYAAAERAAWLTCCETWQAVGYPGGPDWEAARATYDAALRAAVLAAVELAEAVPA